jgi:hypothetical protein
MSKKRFATLSVCLILAMVVTATAHYTFIMPEKFRVAPGEMFNVGFHASDGFPESTQLPKRLESALLHTARGSAAIPAFREDGLRQLATITAPAAGYVVFTALNPARTADMSASSFLGYLKEENLADVIAAREKLGESAKPGRERYSMYLKSIVLVGAPDEGYKRVVGQPIEIVPEKDPLSLKKGESLPVRVLLKGKPAAGVQIFAATIGKPNQNIGKTDSNGRLSVPVQSGRWRLHTIHMERITDPQADWESFWATLTFELP